MSLAARHGASRRPWIGCRPRGRIVGVVGDNPLRPTVARPDPVIYVPLPKELSGEFTLRLRAADPEALGAKDLGAARRWHPRGRRPALRASRIDRSPHCGRNRERIREVVPGGQQPANRGACRSVAGPQPVRRTEGAGSLERQPTMSGSYVQRGTTRLGIGQTEEACRRHAARRSGPINWRLGRSVLGSGPRGRRFKSFRPDQFFPKTLGILIRWPVKPGRESPSSKSPVKLTGFFLYVKAFAPLCRRALPRNAGVSRLLVFVPVPDDGVHLLARVGQTRSF